MIVINVKKNKHTYKNVT